MMHNTKSKQEKKAPGSSRKKLDQDGHKPKSKPLNFPGNRGQAVMVG